MGMENLTFNIRELLDKTLPIGTVCTDNHFITKYHLSQRVIITQHSYCNHVHYYYIVSLFYLYIAPRNSKQFKTSLSISSSSSSF